MAPWRVVALDTVASTNEEARRLAEAGERDPLAVVARVQTQGRGRLGRAWVSPVGGLYASALLRPRIPPERAGLVPLAAGVAMARVVEELGLAPELRWPNDLYLAGRKAGGVLCESRLEPAAGGQPGRLAWVVVGMGLNVAQPPEALAAVGGVGLEPLVGRPLDPGKLLGVLLERLREAVSQVESNPSELLSGWSKRAPMLGRPVKLLLPGGELAGVAREVEPTGALVVTTPAGDRTITDPDLLRVEIIDL